ncbi:MAG: hypothetical protein AAF337_08925 [Pseudomonadota bacterium]
MSRRRDEEFSIAPLPREKRAAKVQRYMLALTFAVVIAAALVVIASILGLAIAPLFERDVALPASEDANGNPSLQE